MSNDKKPRLEDVKESVFSVSDLKYILDVNQKAVEIYVEVEKQNDQILKTLDYFKEASSKAEEQLAAIRESNAVIEELLKDDNAHDHTAIIETLKNLNITIGTLANDVKEIKTSQESLEKQFESEIKVKIAEMDKNLFRLAIILGSFGVGTIITLIQYFIPHK